MKKEEEPKKSSIALPPDERVWPLKPEVMLARGKVDLQAKEEKAIRGAVQDAITTYMNETVTLAEQNYEERREMTDLIQKSAEDAEEIIIRKCAYDKNKVLKYRGRDAEDISNHIDQESALLQNTLNNLVNKRKQRTESLLNLQRRLATMQVDLKYGADECPEQEQQVRDIELNIEKVDQKMFNAQACQDRYHDFLDKLNREKMFYDARLNNIQKFIERDLNDLEVCHDVMIKGKILAHDATAKQDNMENQYREEKVLRENDIKCIRREIMKKDAKDDRKKSSMGDVDLDLVLMQHQNMFQQLQQRRKTLCELDSWEEDYEGLQDITRATTPQAVTFQFESQVERNTYLARELERVDSLRQHQKETLQEQDVVLSSVRHTGAEAMQLLDQQVVELNRALKHETTRLELGQSRMEATGETLTKARTTVRQLLRCLKFVSRPQGWQRNPKQSEVAGDLELLRLKMISLQQRFEAMGAPVRLKSEASIESTSLAVPKSQFRVNQMARSALLPVEKGRVDDMEPMRQEMKKSSFDFTYKMQHKGRRPP